MQSGRGNPLPHLRRAAFEISPAQAADFSWANPVSGDFSDPTSWNPAGPPGPSDTAIFNLGSAGYGVLSSLQDTLQQLQVNNDTVTFIDTLSFPLIVTGTTLPAISFGNNSGDVANVTLDRSLQGVNDAVGYAAGSQATVKLGFGNTSWSDTNLYVGYAGQGSVNLSIFSTLSSSNSAVLGYQTGSQGTVTLNNAGAGMAPVRSLLAAAARARLRLMPERSASVPNDPRPKHRFDGDSDS